MTFEVIQWVIGLLVAAILAALGMVWRGYISLTTTMQENQKEMNAGQKDLHDRIDEVKDHYLRKDDFRTMLEPLQKDVGRINEKLDRLIERDKK